MNEISFMEAVKYSELSSRQRKAVRLKYEADQMGKCWHCKKFLAGPPSDEVQGATIQEELFPYGFFNNPVHLHHSHETGLTIGAVHARCNAFLWQYLGE